VRGRFAVRGILMPALVVLCLPAAEIFTAEGGSSPLDGLDAYVAKAATEWRVPGLAVTVVKDGQVVFAKGYGVRELGKSEPVDPQTLFAIGSTTKAMTAAILGMLVDERKVNWDDPVTRHLPSFQLKDPWLTRELTVRDLLTHRGGLGNADFLWYGQDNSGKEILERARLLEPAYSLRSRFIYQNVMYAAAGAVIEALDNRPWAESIKARIFEPLGMRDTVASLAGTVGRGNVASPHSIVGDKVRVIRNQPVDSVAAAGAVWSNVADLAKWMQFLLEGGRVAGSDGKRLISEATFRELFKPQTIAPDTIYPTTRLVKPHWMTYALGWFQQDYNGRAVDFHTGSIDGMVAIHGLIRDEKLGVFVLGNLDHAELRHALMYTVFDRYAGKSARDWSVDLMKLYGELRTQQQEGRTRVEAQRVRDTSPSLSLERYAGTYTDPLYGTVEIKLEEGVLQISYGSGFVGKLTHWHFNTFRAEWTAEWRAPTLATFVLNAAGRPQVLEMMNGRFTRRAAS
jgi:CubicO group peptidase (beta-lactamase class C family)